MPVSKKVALMLSSQPFNKGFTEHKYWSRLRAIEIDLFEHYWKMVEPSLPLISDNLEYFDDRNDHGFKHSGTREKGSLLLMGIVRVVDSKGDFSEATYKSGQLHGLYRAVKGNEVTV